jgi:Domain of unknown function (DUF4920)
MKHIIIFTFAAMLMGGCDHSHPQPTGTVEGNPSQEFYGAQFDITNAIPVSALATNLAGKDTLDTVIEGVIEQTCPNAGCWLNMRMDNGELQKITTDHVFFVPLDGCKGLKAKAKGKAYQYEISVEDQKHYAMEEGKSEAEIAMITEPKKVTAFTATGVMIEGYKEPEGGAKTGSCTHDHGEEGHDHEHEHHEGGEGTSGSH